MSTGAPRSGGPGAGGSGHGGRVVISSVTGKPIVWDDGEPAERDARTSSRRPILPNRVDADAPEPGVDESNDARIAGDVPPHWGTGR
ncbi:MULTISPECIES: hypothetical protein [Brachybacterium]|uniref:Uncharacterized protein n=1 Tax=Brachybacterium alimentarium TaxID=47845 RepID=A0A2A3YLY7_9MICO|nr:MULTISPECIES: hypothetical protein [Brachybacterium]PCC35960.1 hypothetical protein CIK71_01085 [Brachybacterium alimentarium]PCC40308.1 hypothetical protein CIK66_03955 [Brachybacterium alimentarium]RCS63741.1 hypothetical protein CIK81_11000 [Brachybacterium sp. JB7]RCS67680.1 hypothetical protein CIK68_14300 [Brachybacterium alimentarium]RCS79491.1 hypothetical protein CIK70_07390 [Brachybacterium alimentarium]